MREDWECVAGNGRAVTALEEDVQLFVNYTKKPSWFEVLTKPEVI